MNFTNESKLLLAGGISRALAVGIVYPLDTAKSRLQYASVKPFVFSELYKGYQYTVLSQSIYGMIVFGTYENLKIFFLQKQKNQNDNKLHIYFQTAIISDMIGSVFLCPCEVIKQNIQIGRYKSASQALYSIVMHSGGFVGLYKGYTGLLARDLPFRAIQLPLYDKLKENEKHANLPSGALPGALAGMTAAAMTNPIDIIKTQMMCGIECKTIASAIKRIYAINGGIRGFAVGLPQRVAYLGSMSSIFFIIFEKVKEIMMNQSRPLTS